MERRKALAAAVAATATLGIGTVCFAAIGGAHLFGLGSEGSRSVAPQTQLETITRVVVVHSADGSVVTDPAGAPVTVVETVTTRRVVARSAATQPAPAAAPAAAPASAAAATVAPTTGTTMPAPSSAATTTTVRAAATTTTTIRSTTTVRSTTTTIKAASTTTTIPGVPKDWPVGKPIPPMPAGCEQPQLELNGVWNCG